MPRPRRRSSRRRSSAASSSWSAAWPAGPVLARSATPRRPRHGPSRPSTHRAAPRGAAQRGRVVVEDVGRSVVGRRQRGGRHGRRRARPRTTTDRTSRPRRRRRRPPTPRRRRRSASSGALTRDASTPSPMIAVGPDHQVRSDDGVAHMSERTGAGAVSISYAELFLLPGRHDRSVGRGSGSSRPASAGSRSRPARTASPAAGPPRGHGYLDIAISDNADPTAGWSVYFFVSNDAGRRPGHGWAPRPTSWS